MRPVFVVLLSVTVILHSRSVESLRPAFAFPSQRRANDKTATRLPTLVAPARCKRRHSSTRWMQVPRGGARNSPILTQWIGPALCSALSYASYNIFIKLGSNSIAPILGGVVLQFVAALLGTCLLGSSHDKLTYDKKGILYSALAGIAVGAAEILSFQVSAMGVEASRSTPVMIGKYSCMV